jgi:RNA polymerase sigma-70 factor (ECF subfamily)
MADEFAVLIERSRQGDASAMAELVRHYEVEVRIVARVKLGLALRPYLDSVDLVQSVHRSLLLGLRANKFDISTPEQLTALAVTMVRRKIARQWRRLQRQQRLSHGPDQPDDVVHLLISLSSPQTDPAQQAQFNDQVRRLHANLDETERRILELRLEGHSTDEIAQAVGLKPVALRVRMTRLRQRLRAASILDEWL